MLLTLRNRHTRLIRSITLLLLFPFSETSIAYQTDSKIEEEVLLTGVVYINGTNESYAIIMNKGVERYYGYNAELPNGTFLTAIFKNYILTNDNGKLERLGLSSKFRTMDFREQRTTIDQYNGELNVTDGTDFDPTGEWTNYLLTLISQNIYDPNTDNFDSDLADQVSLGRDDKIAFVNGIKLDGPISVQLIIDSMRMSQFNEFKILSTDKIRTYLIEKQ